MIIIIKPQTIIETPNDYDLGDKVRQALNKNADKPKNLQSQIVVV